MTTRAGPARAPVELTAQQVAELVGGELFGNPSARLTAVGPLHLADEETLSFLTSARYLPAFRSTRAAAVVLPPELNREAPGPDTRILVRDPQAAISRVLHAMYPDEEAPAGRIHPSARLGRGVKLGRGIRIGAGVVLEPGVAIGDGTEIGPNVTVCAGTRIGQRCLIKPGAVLGSPGFGFVGASGGYARIPHIGGCLIGDEVEIGSNCTVDRGSISDTVIGSGTKLDNLVHVGHNSRLGSRCLVMGGSVIAGSAEIGDDVIIAGHAAVGGHFRVGNRARIGAMSGVISAVPDDGVVSGFPARPHRQFLRAQAALYRLARVSSRLLELAGESVGDG